jgi:hypothetical protein
VVSSPRWELDVAIWDEEEWVRIPYQVREILLQLKREFGKLGASRIVVNVRRK